MPSLVDNVANQSLNIVRAAYALDLNEKRLMLAAISKVDPHRYDQDWEHTITADEWRSVYGGTKQAAYKALKFASKSLLRKPPIMFRTGLHTTREAHWVAEAEYQSREGYVKLMISPTIRKHLCFALAEDGFVPLRLLSVGDLRSTHSIRMYELLFAWRRTGEWIVSVSEFREIFDCTLIYPMFSDLRKRIIDKCIKELRAKSDLKNLSCKTIKRGKSVETLRFTFKPILDDEAHKILTRARLGLPLPA